MITTALLGMGLGFAYNGFRLSNIAINKHNKSKEMLKHLYDIGYGQVQKENGLHYIHYRTGRLIAKSGDYDPKYPNSRRIYNVHKNDSESSGLSNKPSCYDHHLEQQIIFKSKKIILSNGVSDTEIIDNAQFYCENDYIIDETLVHLVEIDKANVTNDKKKEQHIYTANSFDSGNNTILKNYYPLLTPEKLLANANYVGVMATVFGYCMYV